MRAGETRARELAIVASSKLEELLNKVFNRLSELNTQIFESQLKIKELQQGARYIYLLELHGCGKECTGCPHHKWVKYYWITTKSGARKLMHQPVDTMKADPAQLIAKSDKNYEDLLGEIRRVKKHIKDKNSLLERLRPFWRMP